MITIPMTYSWPNTVPLPMLDHQGNERTTTLVSPIESGAIIRRCRTRRTYAAINASWTLNVAQFDAFEQFVTVTLGNSVAMFSMDIRYPKTSVLTNYACRFTSEWQAQYTEGLWMVTSQLDLFGPTQLPDPTITLN
jgi:hypothetical protein